MINGRSSFLFVVILFLLSSCAQVVSPTGGEKDLIPPVLLEANPPNRSTNFQSKQVILEFDEFIKLNQLKDQLLISPPMEKEPEIEVRGKKVWISLADSLKANTTYVINFGDAIVDITEQNPYSNFAYAFSTGNAIDSATVSGQIVDAFELLVEPGVLAMLYREAEDSTPYKRLPDYVARTDDNGFFQFEYLAEGSYQLFALKDGNRNYLFDRPDEKVAFQTTEIDPYQTDSLPRLYLFEEPKNRQYITDKPQKTSNLRLLFNMPTTDIRLERLEDSSSSWYLRESNALGDSLLFWFKNLPYEDRFEIAVIDSAEVLDTIAIKPSKLKNDSVLVLRSGKSVQHFYSHRQLTFTAPIDTFDTKLFALTGPDSNLVPFKLQKGKRPTDLWLKHNWTENGAYQLNLLPAAVTDIHDRKNDSIDERFSIDQAKDYGNLQVKIESSATQALLLQLVDEKGKLKSEVRLKDQAHTFQYLPPGNYKLKLIFDENQNGRWDTGRYLDRLQPERIIFFEEQITIRSNWDKEIVWLLPW